MKQTRKAIQESFIHMGKVKPVDKITVKEIVEDCDINRNSLYYHFEDLPDLIESIIEDSLRSTMEENYELGFRAVLHEVVKNLRENADLCRNIYLSRNRDILEMRVSRVITEYLAAVIKADPVMSRFDVSDEDLDIIIQTYRMEVWGFLTEWIQNGMGYDLDARFQRMMDLREGTLMRMLERADRSKKFPSAKKQ